jgi:hypothetical protein
MQLAATKVLYQNQNEAKQTKPSRSDSSILDMNPGNTHHWIEPAHQYIGSNFSDFNLHIITS